MRVLTLLLMLCLASPVFGADANGAYLSQGVSSCGQYIDLRKGRNNTEQSLFLAARLWVGGWITAYNMLKPDTYDIRGTADLDSVMLWLENYCKANPLENLATAMVYFAHEQYPNRKRTKD